MESLKKIGSTFVNTPIGTISGAVVFYLIGKRKMKIENKLGLFAFTALGALVGSTVEYKIRARNLKPTITPGK